MDLPGRLLAELPGSKDTVSTESTHKELISAPNTYHKYNNKDPSHLR